MKYIVIFCCFLIILPQASFAKIIGKTAELQIKTLDGVKFDISDHKGKTVIVNFWASWCSDCLKEMPILNKIYLSCHDKGLEIIGVSIDKERNRKAVLKTASSLSYKNSMLIDAQMSNFGNIEEIPSNYIIDKNGRITAMFSNIEKEDLVKNCI